MFPPKLGLLLVEDAKKLRFTAETAAMTKARKRVGSGRFLGWLCVWGKNYNGYKSRAAYVQTTDFIFI